MPNTTTTTPGESSILAISFLCYHCNRVALFGTHCGATRVGM